MQERHTLRIRVLEKRIIEIAYARTATRQTPIRERELLKADVKEYPIEDRREAIRNLIRDGWLKASRGAIWIAKNAKDVYDLLKK